MSGPRLTVIIIFSLLAISFFVTTGVFIWEFQEIGPDGRHAIMTFYSHLYIFFPTFGVLTLVAFYKPTAVLFENAWFNLGVGGRVRLVALMVILLAASFGFAQLITSGRVPTLFGVPPHELASDRGEPVDCGRVQGGVCQRRDVLSTVKELRAASESRIAMSKFARVCKPDSLLERPDSYDKKRYCFVTRELADAPTCCAAQKVFSEHLVKMAAGGTSLSNRVHEWLLPLKVYFLVGLFSIGLALAWRRKALREHFAAEMPAIQRGLTVGVFAMLFWPVMNHAFVKTSAIILGADAQTFFAQTSVGYSAILGVWAVLLAFFVFGSELDSLGKIASVIGGAFAVLNYGSLVDIIITGVAWIGLNYWTLTGLVGVVLLVIVHVLRVNRQHPAQPRNREEETVAAAG